jgi:hypothetical protein
MHTTDVTLTDLFDLCLNSGALIDNSKLSSIQGYRFMLGGHWREWWVAE